MGDYPAHEAAAKAAAIYQDAAIADEFIDGLDPGEIRDQVTARRARCREVLAERGEWPPLAPGDIVELTGDLLPHRTGGVVVRVGFLHGCKAENVTVDWPADPEFESRAGIKGLPRWLGAIHHRTDITRVGTRPKRRYAVEVERTATMTLYIAAPDRATAEADAKVMMETPPYLFSSSDMDTDGYEYNPIEIVKWPDPDEAGANEFWTGGPDGDWCDFESDPGEVAP